MNIIKLWLHVEGYSGLIIAVAVMASLAEGDPMVVSCQCITWNFSIIKVLAHALTNFKQFLLKNLQNTSG